MISLQYWADLDFLIADNFLNIICSQVLQNTITIGKYKNPQGRTCLRNALKEELRKKTYLLQESGLD